MTQPKRPRGRPRKQAADTLRVHLWPSISGEDDGQGGVRRVIEGMRSSLRRLGSVDVPGVTYHPKGKGGYQHG